MHFPKILRGMEAEACEFVPANAVIVNGYVLGPGQSPTASKVRIPSASNVVYTRPPSVKRLQSALSGESHRYDWIGQSVLLLVN